VVENQDFAKLVYHLNPEARLFGADAASNKINSLYLQTREHIKDMLSELDSKISCTTDIWTSPSMDPFMVVTAHFVDKSFQLRSIVLDFAAMPGSHNGKRIADVFKSIINYYDIKDKVLCVTTDNASNNDTFIDQLIQDRYMSSREHHIRCFAHVINLSVQTALDV
jgi:hypothetical protein